MNPRASAIRSARAEVRARVWGLAGADSPAADGQVTVDIDLLAWMPMLALTGHTRRWEPKKLRLRLFSAAAQLVNTGRHRWLRLTTRRP